jgi:pimeloyl-ACP methyl ester carboxylesterase
VRRALARIAAILAVAWLGWGGALWAAQDTLIFPAPSTPSPTLTQTATRLGITELRLESPDGVGLLAWHSTPDEPPGEARAVLLLHGNGADLRATAHQHRIYRQAGFEVLSLAYRGYPGSEGQPSQEGLVRDAHTGWRWLRQRGIEPGRIAVHGTSLGGGVGAALAAEVQPGALILQSTFTSMVDMARSRAPVHPVRALLRHPFDTLAVAPRLTMPALVLHSRDDGLIPVEHGETLAATLPDAQWVQVDGYGHNGAPLAQDLEVRARVLAFLDAAVPR